MCLSVSGKLLFSSFFSSELLLSLASLNAFEQSAFAQNVD